MSTATVLGEVASERAAQDAKWGEQNHPNGTGDAVAQLLAEQAKAITDKAAKQGTITYADILEEEFWEAIAEADPANLRTELIQVAAVAVAWVEALDRNQV
jgi:hypothetical protein